MRLFIGIELPEDIRRSAADAADRVRARVASAAPRVVLRWVPPENLHITLWFIGEVNDERGASIADVLKTPPFGVRAFTLSLGGAGMFPPSGDPRTVWLGLVEGGDALTSLYGELALRLAPLGFAPEKRPYSPHLTIARVKEIRRRDAAAVRSSTSSAPRHAGTCSIRALTLFQSRTSPKGSQYEPLLRVPLE